MQETNLIAEQDVILFHVRRSIRYHNYRRNFYDSFQQISTGLSLIMGSATVGLAVNATLSGITVFTGAIVTIVSIINLVLKTNEKARLHSELVKKFTDIEKEITLAECPTTILIKQWNTAILSIEVDEPATKFALDARCYNELVRAKAGIK